MKKFLSILLALAVGFTFTFGSAMSAFAAETVDKTPITDAQTAGYKAVDNAATTLLDRFSFDKDGYLTGYYNTGISGFTFNGTDTTDNGYITKATINDVISAAAKTAKTEIQKEATAKYNAASDASAVETGVAAVNTKTSEEVADLLEIFESGNKCALDAAFAVQAKTDKAAALKELGEYTTTQYSDNAKEWSIKGNDTYEGKYVVATVAGVESNDTAYSAKAFVEKMLATQIKAVNDATGTDLANVEAYSNALKIASDIIKGHKIGAAPENYYVAPVPTTDEISKDTTLADAKSYAINKMETALSAQIASEKERINDKIAEMEKLAKPDADALAAYKAALAGLDAQAAAAKEVYTAQINAQTKVADVYTKNTSNAINGGVLKTILTDIASLTIGDYDSTTGKCPTNKLDTLVNTTKEVAKTKAYAADLKALVDRNGAALYDASAINAALEEAIETLYLDTTKTFDSVKTTIDAAANVGDNLIAQKANFVELIEANTSFTKDGKDYKWSTSKSNYEDAQLDAYKKCVDDTEAAILAATTYDEIVAAYINGWNAMDKIITIAEHRADWSTGGKLLVEYNKNYKTDLEAYATYAISKLDPSKYSKAKAADMSAAIDEIIKKAYTKEEIPTQVTAAKAYLDSLKSNDELDAEKKKVEDLITALPTNVTLADKAQVIAARDAAVAYNELPGSEGLLNEIVLTNVVAALAKLEAKSITDQITELEKDAITTADADAIAALDKAIKDYKATYKDEIKARKVESVDTADKLGKFKSELSDAQVAEVIKLCTNVVVNPTTDAEKAAVKAARDAFNALTITQQAEVIATAAYDKLSQAEANMDMSDLDAKAYVQDLAIAVRTAKVGKKVKVTVNADVQTLIDNGYTVTYKFYKSTKKGSGYKNTVNKTTNTYTNTNPVKGKNYYKVKLVVKNADGAVVATTPLTQCKYGVRTIK